MALNQKINSEQICDLSGKALQSDAVVLLKSLDKLLTLGAYYSTSHEQYLLAAEEAAVAIGGAIAPRAALALEITSEGLMILGQHIDPHHRNVRQVHELLVPLNIARLEVGAKVTAADLRQALAALHKHKLLLGKSNTFKEIVIEDLPPTVRSVSRSVLQNDRAAEEAVKGLAAVQEMMDEWSKDSGLGANQQESERLAREFLQMVGEILDNLEKAQAQDLIAGHEGGSAALSRDDFAALRQALKRLVEVNPSPKTLLQLINHARSALEMSRNSGQADLVFRILRKDILAEPEPRPRGKDGKPREVKYQLSVQELVDQVGALQDDEDSARDPEKRAAENHLAICLNLLDSDPPEALRQSLLEALGGLFKDHPPDLDYLSPCLNALEKALESGFAGRAESLLVGIVEALRKGQPDRVGALWLGLKQNSRREDFFLLWPHLVNDLLLGLGQVGNENRRVLLEWAGSISSREALAQLQRLEDLPALKSDKAASDIFKAPLTATQAVHAALARTRLAVWLGRGIHASMKARPFSPLVRALMPAMGDHQASNLDFYLELMAQARTRQLSGELRLKCAVLLLGLLDGLPASRRTESWVPGALGELVKLDTVEAAPLIQNVLNARRWIFWRAWPPACRQAVSGSGEALSSIEEEV
jgi:hypothetical protein